MGLARLVVIEGPDVGSEFAVPSAGGQLGRGDAATFQLTDLTVSRKHCTVEIRDGAHWVVGERTQVNGVKTTGQELSPGDIITIGETRLVFLPATGGVAALVSAPNEGFTLEHPVPGDASGPERCVEELASLFGTTRVILFSRCQKELTPIAANVDSAHPLGRHVILTTETVARVVSDRVAVTLGSPLGPVALCPTPDRGILFAERPLGAEWSEGDLRTLACIAQTVTLAAETPSRFSYVGAGEDIPGLASTLPLLLVGEAGTGKETIARAIHAASPRASEPFSVLNCAATDANAASAHIARAGAGTLYLDQISDLGPANQAALLRAIERGAQVIGGTNRALDSQFRDDLEKRFATHAVAPLRERPTDVRTLAEHFFEQLRPSTPRRVLGLTEDALDALAAHRWPGNIRELRRVIDHAMAHGVEEWIRTSDLPADIQPRGDRPRALGTVADPAQPQSLKELERQGIIAALTATAGNKARAAQILEIDRSTLYKKLKDYDIDL